MARSRASWVDILKNWDFSLMGVVVGLWLRKSSHSFG